MIELTEERKQETAWALSEIERQLDMIRPLCTSGVQLEVVKAFDDFLDAFRVKGNEELNEFDGIFP